MRNGIGKRILIIVALFYVFVTLFAVGILSISSISKEQQKVLEEAVDSQQENRVAAMSKLQEERESNKESSVEAEESSEPSEEASGELKEEEPSEESTEDTGTKYYAFTANNSAGRLNIRKEPSTSAKIVGRMHPGDTGYILDIGDEWSKVSVKDTNGYCANEYLSIREIKEEEYPEELKSLMGPEESVPEESNTPEEAEPEEGSTPEEAEPEESSTPEEAVPEDGGMPDAPVTEERVVE